MARASREGAATRAEPSAQAGVALHPPLRGRLARSERALLRRSADGRAVPADVRTGAVPAEGNGRPLDTAGADLGSGTRAPQRPRLLSVAEHGSLLRAYLTV